jgi:5-methylcytosine-specific restriction enzyme A
MTQANHRNRVHRQPFLNHTARWVKERQTALRIKRADPVVAALYASKEWKVLRAIVLADACGRCATPRCTRTPNTVDHRRPHRGDNALFFSRDNLQAMCKRCHDRKTARYDGAFGRARLAMPEPGPQGGIK